MTSTNPSAVFESDDDSSSDSDDDILTSSNSPGVCTYMAHSLNTTQCSLCVCEIGWINLCFRLKMDSMEEYSSRDSY